MGKSGGRLQQRADPAESRGPLIVFTHIPKTAGTTFLQILRDNVPAGGVGTVGNVFKGSGGSDPKPIERLRNAGALRTRHMYVLSGHLPFGASQHLPLETRYLTFLRDPVDRSLSQYYGFFKLNRRRQLPNEGSLEDVLREREIYDNLQTRMLSSAPDPFGEVTDEILEQAKENLRDRFTAFGLAERFDESLVLFKHALGLKSVLYINQRVGTRPRAEEVSADMRRVAEGSNRYDIELYDFAADLFERRIAELGAEFAVDLAAVRAARTGNTAPEPPELSDVDRRELWELLVGARAELLVERFERATREAGDRRSLQALLEDVKATLAAVDREPSRLSPRSGDAEAVVIPAGGKKRGGRGARGQRVAARAAAIASSREQAAARLGQTRERMRRLETLTGGSAGVEMERLRAEADRLERRLQALERRASAAAGRNASSSDAPPDAPEDAGSADQLGANGEPPASQKRARKRSLNAR